MGKDPKHEKVDMNWLVVDYEPSYNAILGRPSLMALKAVIPQYELMMKFPTYVGIV